MMYLPCYESWAVNIEDSWRGRIIAASYDIPTPFHIEGLTVCVDACYFTFDMELMVEVQTVIADAKKM